MASDDDEYAEEEEVRSPGETEWGGAERRRARSARRWESQVFASFAPPSESATGRTGRQQ